MFNYSADVAFLYILAVFFEALLYGPVLLISVRALKCLRKRRANSQDQVKVLSGIIIVQLFAVSMLLAATLANYCVFFRIRRYSVSTQGIDEIVNNSLYTSSRALGIIMVFLSYIVQLLAHAVLVWRAYVLYSQNVIVRVILLCAWGCALCACMSEAAINVFWMLNWGNAKADYYVDIDIIATWVADFVPVGLNVMVTSCIMYRIGGLRRLLISAGLKPNRSVVNSILTKLVEFGVVLLLVQILESVLVVVYTSGAEFSDASTIAIELLKTVAFMVFNMHPALMALAAKDSISEEERRQDAGGNIETLRFASTGLQVSRISTQPEMEEHTVLESEPVSRKVVGGHT
ncbi:hypothetical protein DL96DRAFT_1812359 [Flagelloscypha sp. PMI_526]|nr:hypothetical protein DL96DRAFT_1812359 [Flagelloscypha sp. PMI_526]